jgi:hypothetical protein
MDTNQTQNLLERADRAIEESFRLRDLNREIRKLVQLTRCETEWQIARPVKE